MSMLAALQGATRMRHVPCASAAVGLQHSCAPGWRRHIGCSSGDSADSGPQRQENASVRQPTEGTQKALDRSRDSARTPQALFLNVLKRAKSPAEVLTATEVASIGIKLDSIGVSATLMRLASASLTASSDPKQRAAVRRDPRIWPLIQQAERLVPSMDPLALSNVANAVARLQIEVRARRLLHRVSGASILKLADFRLLDLAMLLAAFAHFEHPAAPLLRAASHRILENPQILKDLQLPECSDRRTAANNVSQLVWGFGHQASCVATPELAALLADTVVAAVPSMNGKDLANTRSGVHHWLEHDPSARPVWAAIVPTFAARMVACLPDFDAGNLGRALWVPVALGYRPDAAWICAVSERIDILTSQGDLRYRPGLQAHLAALKARMRPEQDEDSQDP